ncbi:DUF1292 domain-containing protein [Bacillus tuaregi]|uniref:DUF1292 domain-containing protein n=1 Tax=Bacillus tuaregi TaxID=1816695 RepID=UPI0008F94840|nr:DUF1292 domain-containing protein [Bacillus tuaregi]
MENDSLRDLVTVEDESGRQVSYEVEALFEMQGESYALLRNQDDTILMRVEEDEHGQHLVNISSASDKESLLDAYQIAVDSVPAEE